MSKTIMLIHGAWLTPTAWELFRGRFEARGYETVAPPWPFEDIPIEDLRSSPPAALGRLTIRTLVDHYAELIRALPSPPIIIGHSFGGLFTQMLLDRGLGAAGVALDSVPFRGVLPSAQAYRAALPVFWHWASWSRVVPMAFANFAATFAQTLPASEMRAAYDRYIVPTPGRIFYQAALGIGNSVRLDNANRPPLLLAVGEADRTIEPSMVRAMYERQRMARSATAFKSFAGRSHFLFAERGWEEVADYALDWASRFEPVTWPPPPVAPPIDANVAVNAVPTS